MFEFLSTGENALNLWLAGFLIAGLVAGIASGFFRARKIQPNGFKWKQFGFEAMVAVISVGFSGLVIGGAQKWLVAHEWITFRHEPAAWWVILLEYAAYFITFDTWFYWLHRWMHNEPFYRWIHKLHHRSTSPNLLTTLSVHPFESFINGGWMVIFITLFTIHDSSMALIGPTNIIMGLYVHSGYEFFPRWWNKSWLTKWFITATFHDQHHKYFTANFGGYTTVWDRICGTVRPKFEADYLKLKDRAGDWRKPASPTETVTP
ncbi:MAG: sterol desaturase family protein [Novosphingobium sp.]